MKLSFNQTDVSIKMVATVESDISIVTMILWSHPVNPEQQSVLPRSPDTHLLRLHRHIHPAHRLFGSQRHQRVNQGEVGFLHQSQEGLFNHLT